ncbi:MAG: Hsp20/alpha crystallin family protein [Candidatus Omnitrophica bacterium]|nr:Hsp20/alpha crystallin family protein [Candidatus Omnitrophota bacterium]
MKNKVFVIIIVILAGLLILETNYLLNSRGRMKRGRRIACMRQGPLHMPMQKNFKDDFSALDEPMVDPFAGLERVHQRMNSMFEDDFAKDFKEQGMFGEKAGFAPRINVKKTESAYLVKADLPGMEKSTINVEVKGGSLVLSGERKEETSQEDTGFYKKESSYGSFLRTILLPDDAKITQITSQYNNGVLTITIPREKDKTETPQTIKVPVQ